MVTRRAHPGAFTLIELLVAMAIVAVLLSLAVPSYLWRIEAGQEAVLRDNLRETRDALDKFYGDNSRYPDALTDLVTRRYLRRMPIDPVTGSDHTWIIVAPADTRQGGVVDIKSGAPGNGRDGTPYSSW
jgi:general secretion pathway protein G